MTRPIEGNSSASVTASYYDKLAPLYDQTYSDPISDAENHAVADVLRENVGRKILDVGCGTGILLDLVDVEDYVGFDISQGMVARAKSKHPDRNFFVGDMHDLTFSDNSFDTIVCLFGTFSYSLAPEQLFGELLRVLEPGGKMIIMPSSLRMEKRLKMGISHSTTDAETVRKVHYTEEMLRQVFGALDDLQIRGLNYFANTMEELNRDMETPPLNVDFYKELLERERNLGSLVPAEYARHIILIGQKPITSNTELSD